MSWGLEDARSRTLHRNSSDRNLLEIQQLPKKESTAIPQIDKGMPTSCRAKSLLGSSHERSAVTWLTNAVATKSDCTRILLSLFTLRYGSMQKSGKETADHTMSLARRKEWTQDNDAEAAKSAKQRNLQMLPKEQTIRQRRHLIRDESIVDSRLKRTYEEHMRVAQEVRLLMPRARGFWARQRKAKEIYQENKTLARRFFPSVPKLHQRTCLPMQRADTN